MSDDGRYRGRIVVGFDGSDPSLTAVRWAASAATLRGRDLVLLYALLPPTSSGGFGVGMPPSLDLLDQLEAAARQEVEDLADPGAEGHLHQGSRAEEVRHVRRVHQSRRRTRFPHGR